MEKRGPLNRRLGANLRAIRLARGFTQEEWAMHLGYDRTYVASVERGERNLTLDTLTALAEQIDVDPLELLEDHGTPAGADQSSGTVDDARSPADQHRPTRRAQHG